VPSRGVFKKAGADDRCDRLGRGWERSQMAPLATSARNAVAELDRPAPERVLGSLTIPGRPDQVGAARSFVARNLGGHPASDVLVLLASETVTNAVLHSNSRHPGGTVTVTVLEAAGGLRVDVADAGSELNIPQVKGNGRVTSGHGLFLVQALADEWGYARAEAGTTVWFWVAPRQR
jgi:anti-sigma regulatory factor (Ser/Thr protein kinase)